MPSLLQGQDITCFSGAAFDHFLTFSQSIIINKEPKKTVSNSSTPAMFGYPSRRQEVSYDLVPQSGIFSAIINYNVGQQNLTDENGLQLRIPEGNITMKTTGGCKDYIMDGSKTKNLIIDNKLYNITSSPKIQKYLGLDFYYFILTESK